VGSRSIQELAKERDRVLLGLLALRTGVDASQAA
jgi:hypothetical protein